MSLFSDSFLKLFDNIFIIFSILLSELLLFVIFDFIWKITKISTSELSILKSVTKEPYKYNSMSHKFSKDWFIIFFILLIYII